MLVWMLLVAGLVVVATAVALVLRKRLDTAERTLRSVAAAAGTSDVDARLVQAVRQQGIDGLEARIEADRFSSAFRGAAIGMALLTPEGSLEYVSEAASAVLEGGGQASVLRTRVESLVRRVADTGESEDLEVDIHEPDRRVLLLAAVPIAVKGGTDSVALYLQDMSDQRRVAAMRTDFVANASHELKTPLGALALLAETLADAEDPNVRDRLAHQVRGEALRMANTIDDILRLAETESLGADHVPLSIGALLEDVVSSMQEFANQAGVTLMAGDLVDATVAADRDQLVSALRNLLDNAIAYTAVKGVHGEVHCSTRIVGSNVCIDIADTGIGIPARYADRVFERFFRVDRARSRVSGGTGLGLSIVRNVALAHGGTVDVDSRVGVGSTFTMCLPRIVEADV